MTSYYQMVCSLFEMLDVVNERNKQKMGTHGPLVLGWLRVEDPWNIIFPSVLPSYHQLVPPSFCRISLLPIV